MTSGATATSAAANSFYRSSTATMTDAALRSSACVAIAERSSFAKAATQLSVSRSTLSETLRTLEDKLGVRLLNRTTRSVALTEAGERLLDRLRPVLENFDAVVESVNHFRDKPAGHLRLTVPRPAARTVIEPSCRASCRPIRTSPWKSPPTAA